MLLASLRRSGGSLILTVPATYVEQNHLSAGSMLAMDIVGDELKIRPKRARRTLEELLAATLDLRSHATTCAGLKGASPQRRR